MAGEALLKHAPCSFNKRVCYATIVQYGASNREGAAMNLQACNRFRGGQPDKAANLEQLIWANLEDIGYGG